MRRDDGMIEALWGWWHWDGKGIHLRYTIRADRDGKLVRGTFAAEILERPADERRPAAFAWIALGHGEESDMGVSATLAGAKAEADHALRRWYTLIDLAWDGSHSRAAVEEAVRDAMALPPLNRGRCIDCGTVGGFGTPCASGKTEWCRP